MLLRSTILVLVAAAVVSDGCAIVNKMSGVSEARAIQKIGEPAQATVLQVWDTGVTVKVDPKDPNRLALDVHKYD